MSEEMKDEMIELQNQIIREQEKVIKTADELIAAYEKLTDLMQEKIERSNKDESREKF